MVPQFEGKGICGGIVACPSLLRPQDLDSFAGFYDLLSLETKPPALQGFGKVTLQIG
jgi:hypothetical protein